MADIVEAFVEAKRGKVSLCKNETYHFWLVHVESFRKGEDGSDE